MRLVRWICTLTPLVSDMICVCFGRGGGCNVS
ncbi:hypothetical protein BRADI_4g22015v3 [Brachypodium distachyon]|uniref:Uncharacterized protein n=1 Tax=Brachypodium distachyon TaxID=15368 RepID=A0A0Q3EN31_BRADI|nr:hypothetical protein BRADI_4g22015v3 [Brachypodium distachyon]